MEAHNRIAQLVTDLGPPAVWPAPAGAVWVGDALELLQRVPTASVPLVVTSPPYNIGKPYEKRRGTGDYLDWCTSWLTEIRRVLTPNGAAWLNLGFVEVLGRGRAVPIPYLLWDRLGMYLVQEVVWTQQNGIACRRRLSPRNEKLLWLVKDPRSFVFNLDAIRDPDVRYPNQRVRGRNRCNPLGKNPGDVWAIPRVTAGRAAAERTNHPAQMPLALASRIITACSIVGDVVLDPFAGSGTTIVAAVGKERVGVGFERYSEYARLVVPRVQS